MREKTWRKKEKKMVHSKVIYEKAIEVNNDLKLNVDEQQDEIKHLKNNLT